MDEKKQCIQIFPDICTVLDDAFGRLTIERCWDTWLNECQNINNIDSTFMQKQSQTSISIHHEQDQQEIWWLVK